MNTIIDSLKYLLQERYNHFLRESSQYISSPYKRDMDIIKKLMTRLDLIKKYINKFTVPVIGFILVFTFTLWILKILLH